MDCLFCKIIKGEIPSYTVYENEYVKCFLDINPNTDGHTLVIPKKHNKDVMDLENDSSLHVLAAIKELIKLYDKVLKPDGYRITKNNGIVQDIMHYHVHVIPIYKDKKDNNEVEIVYNKIKNDTNK